MTTMLNQSNVSASEEVPASGMPYEFHFGIGVYLLITGVFGGVGNILVVVMFAKNKQLTSAVDLLLLNLAVADVGMCCVCFPFVAASSFAGRWLFGESGCTAYGYMGFLFGNTASCTLTAISVQRYLVVCRGRSNVCGTTTVRILLYTWFQAVVWSTLPLILPRPYGPEPFGTSCSVSWASPEPYTRIFICSLVSWFLLHFIIFTGCYVNIYFTSKHLIRSTSSRKSKDLLVSKICFILVFIFVVCWAPYAVFSLWLSSTSVRVPLIITAMPVMLAKVSSCLNPILYIIVSQRFRDKYLTLLTCGTRGRDPAQTPFFTSPAFHSAQPRPASIQLCTMLDVDHTETDSVMQLSEQLHFN